MIHSLSLSFPLKDLGSLHFFLGLEIHPFANGLHLSQAKYICDLLKKTNMDASKPVTSPMSASVKLSLNDGPLFDKPTLYRNTIGSLQYLSLTCPDIAYSINKVCQFMHNPTVPHWQAVKRILRYLKNIVYTFVPVLIIRYMPLLMRIGLDAQMIAALLVPSAFFLGLILYPEVLRNRALSLIPTQKLNTRP